ncbi:MAG TPA: hypothetical protein IGS17_21390 [Oscillatoriales cyanobacterium M59_W2019_021]|nr:hypothetical protein [Oscillatoriales cyanobacterium M4454_W2019_049]HIK53445.1 hypothetical protein [Oscillatoriales cyanobacterium M59_W2019_021]
MKRAIVAPSFSGVDLNASDRLSPSFPRSSALLPMGRTAAIASPERSDWHSLSGVPRCYVRLQKKL